MAVTTKKKSHVMNGRVRQTMDGGKFNLVCLGTSIIALMKKAYQKL